MYNNGAFKVKKITKLKDLIKEKINEISESDLAIQTKDHLIQFSYVEKEEKIKKFKIKPGSFTIVATNTGINLTEFELRNYNLLKTLDNTKLILNESNKFFSKLNIYKELKEDARRAILLCSPPGYGKTTVINEICKSLLAEEGTCVVIWDTSSIRADQIDTFFQLGSEFTPAVKRLILVIEDIETSTSEGREGYAKDASSSLLNFLDGMGIPFSSVPTFIIGTTNNPERSVGALIDRPKRFDKVIELKAPTLEGCTDLMCFLLKKDLLNEDEQSGVALAAKNEFSLAHIQEIIVRSKLDDISITESAQQLVDHKKRFKDGFSKKPRRGINLEDDSW